MKVYGPYACKDGRLRTVIVYDDGSRTTKSTPRLIMEEKLGRELLPTEEVDHIDDDKTNNSSENYQVLTKQENLEKQHRLNPRQLVTFTCPVCWTEVTRFKNYVDGNKKKGRKGPFCGRKCAGVGAHPNFKAEENT